MTTEIATREPAKFAAGDRVQWQRTLDDYPAGTWTLAYYLLNASGRIAITASAQGTDHLVDVAAATTKAWAAGFYDVQGYVTSGSDRRLAWSGRIEILPNFALAGSLDYRSHARRVLEAIEAVLESKATGDQLEYTIGSRSLKKMTHEELIRVRGRYKAEVEQEDIAERIANGLGGGNKVVFRL